MAERSKAPVSGTGLFGGVGSNPTPIIHTFCTFFFSLDPVTRIPNLVLPGETTSTVGWPSGPRRQFKALVSSEAWVRIPLQSYIPVSLVGQDTRLSPVRPGFKSRTGNIFFFGFHCRAKMVESKLVYCGGTGLVCLQSSVGRAGGC